MNGRNQLVINMILYLFTSVCIAEPQLINQIQMEKHGGFIVRYGDFDNDGKADILAVQNKGPYITCLTAMNMNGKIIWQKGTPKRKNNVIAFDLPVQVYDWNRDGRDEVIVVMDGELQIRSGRNGRILRKTPAPSTANDAVMIGKFWGKKLKILIKDRYKKFWVFDQKLKLISKSRTNTGHFPFMVDSDYDGTPELLVGYSLYRKKRRIAWELPLKGHSDASDAGDMDNDGRIEIAIANSNKGFLASDKGELLWDASLKHAQHVIMGHFLRSAPETQQVAFVDRMNNSTIHFLNRDGEQLWQSAPQGPTAMVSTIDGWTGKRNESLILVSRRDIGYPALMDGQGQIVTEFPFPPAFTHPETTKHFVQHFDLTGDGREEILINNHREIWIYTNSNPAPEKIEINESLPNSRIYNATFYTGMQ